MQSMRTLFVFTSWSVATICVVAASQAAPPDQQALVARVEQLIGRVTRSKSGDIIAVDLENRAATNDDRRQKANERREGRSLRLGTAGDPFRRHR